MRKEKPAMYSPSLAAFDPDDDDDGGTGPYDDDGPGTTKELPTSCGEPGEPENGPSEPCRESA
jgi:hypothetical protein